MQELLHSKNFTFIEKLSWKRSFFVEEVYFATKTLGMYLSYPEDKFHYLPSTSAACFFTVKNGYLFLNIVISFLYKDGLTSVSI